MRFSRLGTYIFTKSLIGLLIALAGVGASITMVDLVEEMRAISSSADGNIAIALTMSMLRLPSLIEETIPIAMMIGTILTFTELSRNSEIIAMRAAGISAWKFLKPLAFLSLLVGLIIVLFIGPVSSKLDVQYENLKNKILSNIEFSSDDNQTVKWSNILSKNSQIVLYGKTTKDKDALNNVTLYIYDKSGTKLLSTIDAQSAKKSNEKLILQNTISSKPGTDPVYASNFVINILSLEQAATDDPKTVPIWELPHAAKIVAQNGGSASKYWLRFYRLLALPITIIAMSIFSAIMCIGLDRSGGKLKSVFIGIVVSLIMYFGNDIAGLMATSGSIPDVIAAFCPPLFALSITLAFLSFKEDGAA